MNFLLRLEQTTMSMPTALMHRLDDAPITSLASNEHLVSYF